jgi:hypothetical protein
MRKKKGLKRRVKGTCFCRPDIDKESSCAKSFNPKMLWKRSLEKQGGKNIIDGSKRMFGLAILRRGVGT